MAETSQAEDERAMLGERRSFGEKSSLKTKPIRLPRTSGRTEKNHPISYAAIALSTS
jgi:hypothetical protein